MIEEEQEERGVRVIPLVLDTREMSHVTLDHQARRAQAGPVEYAGGLEWSPGFKKYLRGVLPVTVANERGEERREWREWWTVEYVVDRLRAQLSEPDAVDAVIAYEQARYYGAAREIAKRYQQSAGWLLQQHRLILSLVRRWYLPYSAHHQARTYRSARRERRLARERAATTES